jgi:hypothetical protein
MAYTSGSALVRAVMTAASGLPADAVVNDFAFQKGSAITSGDWTTLFDLVDDFYNVTQASGASVGQHISNQINRAATHELQGYIITAPPMGSPAATIPWLGPVTNGGATGLPTEVAGVLSFHADLTGVAEEAGATRPRARRRGRVFIGPLIAGAVDNVTPPYLLKSTTFLTTLRQAAVALMDAADTAGIPWSVWSRSDATLRPVVGGWTDDAPDTQRRRGPAATTRVTWG